jgi:hypothetical protein
MHLRLALNFLHFLPDLGAPYALRREPSFYKIHPWSCSLISIFKIAVSVQYKAPIYKFGQNIIKNSHIKIFIVVFGK